MTTNATWTGTRAVVTGGASGIGLGLTTALLEGGAAGVAVADIEQAALDEAVSSLQESFGHATVIGVRTDVADAASVEALAVEAWERLGGVDVLCANAGVFTGGYSWEMTDDDWDWVLGVNVRGIANGIRSFVPRMIEAGTPSRVIATASIAGLVAAPVSAVYCTSKFAAVGLCESLHHDLGLAGVSTIDVSIICPGMVSTRIGEGERNRPAHLAGATATESAAFAGDAVRSGMVGGLDPIVGARHALGQVLDGRFYATTHEGDLWYRLVGNENEARIQGNAPPFQMYE